MTLSVRNARVITLAALLATATFSLGGCGGDDSDCWYGEGEEGSAQYQRDLERCGGDVPDDLDYDPYDGEM